MLSINLIWFIASVTTACVSGYALKKYLNKHMKNHTNLNNSAFHANPYNPAPQNPNLPVTFNSPLNFPFITESPKFDRILEQTIVRNLFNTRTNIVLELPEDTEIELLGKKWTVKAGSKIRIGTPRKSAKPRQTNPLDEFFRRGERK